jgi:hypothetical protein
MYKALTYVNLPPDNRKAPGDSISEKELKDAGQTVEDVEVLIKQKAIGAQDAEINKAHAPIEIIVNTTDVVNVITSEVGRSDEHNG